MRHDWPLIGRNVRRMRLLQAYTQEELAALSEISPVTVYKLERGESVTQRSLLKIVDRLQTSVEFMSAPMQETLDDASPVLVHRADELFWTDGTPDRRAHVPENNLRLIQDSKERVRLGRLGFVDMFISSTRFIMPEGPGNVFIELFRRYAEPLNERMYRFGTLLCTQGAVRVGFRKETVELHEGDMVGYRTEEFRWMEPLNPDDTPTCLTLTGASRLGKVSGGRDPKRTRHQRLEGDRG